jgi:hypothetical protein
MSPRLFVLNFVRMNRCCPEAAGPNNTNPYSDWRRKFKRVLSVYHSQQFISVISLHSPRVKVVDM